MARHPRRRGERGATAVLVAVLLSMLIGFVALAMNIGHRTNIRTELQTAADSAALAGAKELDGTLEKITAAAPQQWAWDFAQRHETDRGERVLIDRTLDVELGVWDPLANPDSAFTPVSASTLEQARVVNAVRVRTFRETQRGNPVQVWMDAFLGQSTMDVAAEAVAVYGGPCLEDCPDVPLAFFDCGIYYNSELQCWTRPRMRAEMAPDPSDTIGFSSLSPTATASTDTYRDILSHDNCAAYDTQIGQEINVSNGNQLSPLCGLDGFDQYCHANAAGDCTLDPRPKIRAPVVDGQCDIAAGILPKFNQPHAVVGYATFVMTKLVCSGNTKFMEFEFLCEEVDDQGSEQYGCGFWGTGPLQPQLVR
jgi:Flp pilus assembly protein TadG